MFTVSAPYAGRLTVTWQGTGDAPTVSEVRAAVVAQGQHRANHLRSIQHATDTTVKGTRYVRWFVYVSR